MPLRVKGDEVRNDVSGRWLQVLSISYSSGSCWCNASLGCNSLELQMFLINSPSYLKEIVSERHCGPVGVERLEEIRAEWGY